jgi:hypothetical protein
MHHQPVTMQSNEQTFNPVNNLQDRYFIHPQLLVTSCLVGYVTRQAHPAGFFFFSTLHISRGCHFFMSHLQSPCKIHTLNTITTRCVVVNSDGSSLMCLFRTGQQSTYTWIVFQQQVPFLIRTPTRHVLTVAKLDEIMLDCRRHLYSEWACLRHQHKMNQNCCTHIHVSQLWFTRSTTQFVKKDRILWTGTFTECTMEKYTPNTHSVRQWNSVSFQNKRFLTLIYEVSSQYVTGGVWCGALWVQLRITRPMFCETINSHRHSIFNNQLNAHFT